MEGVCAQRESERFGIQRESWQVWKLFEVFLPKVKVEITVLFSHAGGTSVLGGSSSVPFPLGAVPAPAGRERRTKFLSRDV